MPETNPGGAEHTGRPKRPKAKTEEKE